MAYRSWIIKGFPSFKFSFISSRAATFLWATSLEKNLQQQTSSSIHFANLGNKPQSQASQIAPEMMIQIAMTIRILKDNLLVSWQSSLLNCSIWRLSASSDGMVCSTWISFRFGFVFWSNAEALIEKIQFCDGVNKYGVAFNSLPPSLRNYMFAVHPASTLLSLWSGILKIILTKNTVRIQIAGNCSKY